MLGLYDQEFEWMQTGACREEDPDLFFPERGGDFAAPKEVCARCDVKDECLAYAMDNHIQFGIWGGTSEHERRKLRGTWPKRTERLYCKHCGGRFEHEHNGITVMFCSKKCRGAFAQARQVAMGEFDPANCGTLTNYNKGCRCGECRATKSAQRPRSAS